MNSFLCPQEYRTCTYFSIREVCKSVRDCLVLSSGSFYFILTILGARMTRLSLSEKIFAAARSTLAPLRYDIFFLLSMLLLMLRTRVTWCQWKKDYESSLILSESNKDLLTFSWCVPLLCFATLLQPSDKNESILGQCMCIVLQATFIGFLKCLIDR